ncbi:PREDICTED: uncharacterized protein LOC104702925 [Camelina sativa]|uniref:Uncharacterized protein LOC104702925 n=1 Tax=Camelina sativa TaxID=90675 RepID=A0ABM0SWI5_CAMSA|nr:PREDICTED: uncharacterized protein LOC104702925 [Camelina sativa]
MKTNSNCVFMASLLVITTLVLFAYPSLASKLEDNEEPLIDPNVDLDPFARSPTTDEYNRDMTRKLPKYFMEYALVCGQMMGAMRCNEEVLSEILQDKPASRYCCMKMMIYGEKCHMAFRDFMFKVYKFKQFASKARPRIRQVWNRCYAEVGGLF